MIQTVILSNHVPVNSIGRYGQQPVTLARSKSPYKYIKTSLLRYIPSVRRLFQSSHLTPSKEVNVCYFPKCQTIHIDKVEKGTES